jgi:hypothetical protein
VHELLVSVFVHVRIVSAWMVVVSVLVMAIVVTMRMRVNHRSVQVLMRMPLPT